MKTTSFANQITLRLFLILLLTIFNSSAHAASLSFVPDSSTVELGNSINIDIIVSDLGNGASPSLSAFDIGIAYLPTFIDASTVSYGTSLNNGDPIDSFTNTDLSTAGLALIGEVSFLFDLDNTQLDSFILATLSFDALALGTSTLAFDFTGLGAGLFGSDLLATQLAVDVTAGSIEVIASSNVPEPSTLLLLIGGMVFIRKRTT